MLDPTDTSFHKFYIEAMPLIRAKARFLYGGHRTYDVAVSSKNNAYVATLVAYGPNATNGTVLAVMEVSTDAGADVGYTWAVNKIDGALKRLVADKLGDSPREGEV